MYFFEDIKSPSELAPGDVTTTNLESVPLNINPFIYLVHLNIFRNIYVVLRNPTPLTSTQEARLSLLYTFCLSLPHFMYLYIRHNLAPGYFRAWSMILTSPIHYLTGYFSYLVYLCTLPIPCYFPYLFAYTTPVLRPLLSQTTIDIYEAIADTNL